MRSFCVFGIFVSFVYATSVFVLPYAILTMQCLFSFLFKSYSLFCLFTDVNLHLLLYSLITLIFNFFSRSLSENVYNEDHPFIKLNSSSGKRKHTINWSFHSSYEKRRRIPMLQNTSRCISRRKEEEIYCPTKNRAKHTNLIY